LSYLSQLPVCQKLSGKSIAFNLKPHKNAHIQAINVQLQPEREKTLDNIFMKPLLHTRNTCENNNKWKKYKYCQDYSCY
jgi:hypothetical protein